MKKSTILIIILIVLVILISIYFISKTTSKPSYMPEGFKSLDSKQTISKGFVIVNKKTQDEYVWIPVDVKYKEGNSDEETLSNMKVALRTYLGYSDAEGNINKVVGRDEHSDIWNKNYAGLFDNEQEYNEAYNKVIKSMCENKGFYIGRYELGVDDENLRTAPNDELPTPVIKQNKYVYNFVTAAQAKEVAEKVDGGDCKTSMMFGIQWDAIMKFLENNGTIFNGEKLKDKTDLINADSTKIGNYPDSTFTANRGKLSRDSGITWEDAKDQTKKENENWLLTTGAVDNFKILNIYDLAGNAWEWTFENCSNPETSCIARGGNAYGNGTAFPVSGFCCGDGGYSMDGISTRVALYR